LNRTVEKEYSGSVNIHNWKLLFTKKEEKEKKTTVKAEIKSLKCEIEYH